MKCEKKICWRRWLSAGIVIMLVTGIWCGYQIWRSYHTLEISIIPVTLERWTTEGSGDTELRVAVLADLHASSFGEENQLLAEQVLAQQPDLIIMAGDMLDEQMAHCDDLLALVEQLALVCPVYYGLGNHERDYVESYPQLLDQLTQAGAVVLEESYVDTVIGGREIRIGGMYAYGFFSQDPDKLAQMSASQQKTYGFLQEFQATDACKVLICHRPDSFIFNNAGTLWDVDLVISGHVHGGQVVVPFLGGLWAPDQGWWPDYVQGLHRCGQVWVAITTGLGSQTESLPRFNNPPEILIMDIRGQGN